MLHVVYDWARTGDRVTIQCPVCREETWILRSGLDRDGCGLIDCVNCKFVAVRLGGAEALLDLLVPPTPPRATGPAT